MRSHGHMVRGVPVSDYIDSGAIMSDCGQYRYVLSRSWSSTGASMLVIGLNPSTADAEKDDPTIRRCVGFAKMSGCAILQMGNLFALRSTNPKALTTADDPIGYMNDYWLQKTAKLCRYVVAAWGANPLANRRIREVLPLLNGRPLLCWGVTKTGAPRHPLYLARDTKLMRWEPPDDDQ